MLFTVFSMIPIGLFMFLNFNKNRLNEPKFKASYGAMYMNYSTNKTSAFIFNVFFILRRLVFALTLVRFFSDIIVINVLIQIKMSFVLIIYIYKIWPFEMSRDNWIEIINESSILFVYYLTLGVIVNDENLNG